MFRTAKYLLLAAFVVALSKAWSEGELFVIEVQGPDSRPVKIEVGTIGRPTGIFHLPGLGHTPADDVGAVALTTLAGREGVLSSSTLGQGLTYADYLQTRSVRLSFQFPHSIDVLVHVINKLQVQAPILSGHSFGGNRALYLQNRIRAFDKVVLWTPGVANNDEFLVSREDDSRNTIAMYTLDITTMLLGMGAQGENVALNKIKEYLNSVIPDFKSKSVAADGMARQVLSFDNYDLRKVVLEETFPTDKDLFVVTASADRLVFPMLHYELVMNSRNRGIPAVGIIVGGPGHLVLDSISPEAAKTVARLVDKGASNMTKPFCLVNSNGKIEWLTEAQALELYRFMTGRVWQAQEPILKKVFAGVRIEVPKSWGIKLNQEPPEIIRKFECGEKLNP